jgi:hypothetical protein
MYKLIGVVHHYSMTAEEEAGSYQGHRLGTVAIDESNYRVDMKNYTV